MTTAQSTDTTRPSFEVKGQPLLDLKVIQKKFVDLAEVILENKLSWRPSVSAGSLLHVAEERYGVLALMGASARRV